MIFSSDMSALHTQSCKALQCPHRLLDIGDVCLWFHHLHRLQKQEVIVASLNNIVTTVVTGSQLTIPVASALNTWPNAPEPSIFPSSRRSFGNSKSLP